VAAPDVSSLPRLRLQFSITKIPELAGRYSFEEEADVIRMAEAARLRGHFTKPEFVEICRWKTDRSKRLVALRTLLRDPAINERARRLGAQVHLAI